MQFVGVSAEDASQVARFAREVGVNYPLWVGVVASELSRRLVDDHGASVTVSTTTALSTADFRHPGVPDLERGEV